MKSISGTFRGAAALVVLAGIALSLALALEARQGPPQQRDPAGDPFKGVTANGSVRAGLFPVAATGVTTAPVKSAAERFIASLTDAQKQTTLYPVDDNEWRRWNNVHRATRQGVSFKEMTENQRTRAIDLLRASLSAKGLQKTRDIMRLNETIAEITNRLDEYGEFLYHMTVMGTPADKEPWGWQLEGHHLIINYFILGDQVVMTPTFMGSEPVVATSGKYAGTSVMQDEQNKGLAFMNALNPEQRTRATLRPEKTANNAQSQAGQDNLVLDFAGLKVSELSEPQKARLLDLVGEFVNNMAEGHARVKMSEVRKHLDETYFAWVGGTTDTSVFYYRVHSPVVLIEFDHQTPVAIPGPRVPGRAHVHSVVRTPNGNDYGKDLLRQHYEARKGDPAHGHRRQR